MNLNPMKYPDAHFFFATDWTARMLGGPETLKTLWWSRKTYGIHVNDWVYDEWGVYDDWDRCDDIDNAISDETHPGVFQTPQR